MYKAKDLLTGNIVALKKVRCDVREKRELKVYGERDFDTKEVGSSQCDQT